MAPSYSERQAQYAAWRDRLRDRDEVITLDDEPADDRWSPEALFRASASVDHDAGGAHRS
jgi:hypothetical protein